AKRILARRTRQIQQGVRYAPERFLRVWTTLQGATPRVGVEGVRAARVRRHPGVREHHSDVREQERAGDEDPHEPVTDADDREDEAGRPDAHRDEVATLPDPDVVVVAALRGGDPDGLRLSAGHASTVRRPRAPA